jgi:hypothetical protein
MPHVNQGTISNALGDTYSKVLQELQETDKKNAFDNASKAEKFFADEVSIFVSDKKFSDFRNFIPISDDKFSD